MTYVGVSPTRGLEVCLKDLEDQMRELPHSIGLKLYPDEVEPFRSWRMDDPNLAYPLFERAQKLGIKTVAIHKAIPNGPVPINPYRVDDVDGAAIHFPDSASRSSIPVSPSSRRQRTRSPASTMSMRISRYQPIDASRAGAFQRDHGAVLFWGGPEKIVYSDGTLFCHSQPLLEKFWNLEFSEELKRQV